MTLQFTRTNESIVVIDETGKPITVRVGAPNFNNLAAALDRGDFEEAKKHLTVSDSLEAWAKGKFTFKEGQVFYNGDLLPVQLLNRMKAMAAKGESPEPLFCFWEKLQKNPSARSVEQLFPFLEHAGIPILPNGNFLAYKGVKSNYTDAHSGKVDNKPGTINEMARNKISDDPRQECHYGFHVGALSYARGFSNITIVCEVDPRDVVSIPYDYNHQKMRVCKYRVVGNHNGELLPSTLYELEGTVDPMAKGEDQAQVVTGEAEEQVVVEEKKDEDDTGEAEEQVVVEEKKDEDDTTLELNEQEKRLVDNGQFIYAIKSIRSRSSLGLKEAKGLCDSYRQALVQAPNKPQKELKEARPEKKKMVLKVPAKYKKIHEMELKDLMKQTIDDLRSYAGKCLFIVGASKIPGGKIMLAKQILKTRKQFK